MTYVVPVFRSLLAGYGAELSLPSRLAIGTSRIGVLLLVLWAGALVVAYVRDRRAPGRRVAGVLAVTALLMTLYLGAVGWVYVDAAIALPVHRVP